MNEVELYESVSETKVSETKSWFSFLKGNFLGPIILSSKKTYI